MSLESAVKRTIQTYHLITPRDRVLCAVSGGKDSTVALYLVSMLFQNVEAVTIDPAIGEYSKKSLVNVRRFCAAQGIRLHEISFRKEFGHSLCRMQSILEAKGLRLSPCTICGVLKRYLLNRKARELGSTKLVTGHNLDDEAQSILMNLLRGNLEPLAKLGPTTGKAKRKFVARAKPLVFCSEQEVERYCRKKGFPVAYGRCPCSSDSYRNTVRNLLNGYETKVPGTKKNLLVQHLRMLEDLQQVVTGGVPLSTCESCGEPSRNSLCMACTLVSRL